jgi:hypothetical protein
VVFGWSCKLWKQVTDILEYASLGDKLIALKEERGSDLGKIGSTRSVWCGVL